MIVYRTPFRMSFFGGGTDIPDWYQKHGGSVLSMSFDRYSYASLRVRTAYFKHKYRVVYSIIEQTDTLTSIKHPLVRAVLEYFNVKDPVEIHHDTDLPGRSGIGSSSAFAAALIASVAEMNNIELTDQQIIELAIHIERDVLNEYGGIQDQIAVVKGGLNRIDINQDGTYSTRNVFSDGERSINQFEDQLLICFSGLQRNSYDISDKSLVGTQNEKTLIKMMDMVQDAHNLLIDQNWKEFGYLLHENWKLKRSLKQNISNTSIDDIYQTAIASGAYGGKLMGAGSGGFLMFIAPKNRHDSIRKALPNCLISNVKCDRLGLTRITESL